MNEGRNVSVARRLVDHASFPKNVATAASMAIHWRKVIILSFQKIISGLIFRLLVSIAVMESLLPTNPTIKVRFAHQVRMKPRKAGRGPPKIGNDTISSQTSPLGEN